ncbi:transcription factor bHLH123 isoform X2 [Gossypium raimondii]|uniref:transcription factor bHLH123 isoform X2 n=1 Tax=Gossypium raimondii TaxID=29730 RepID=UPI00227B9377|nr:transcription factor bHLH123 isoform X2 [Gossypium raimondii]
MKKNPNQLLIMRNALLSSLPLPSQFYNIGNNEAQMSYLDVLMRMETIGNVEVDDAFSSESKTFNNGDQLGYGAFAAPYQSHFNSDLRDHQFGSVNFGTYFQPSMSLNNKLAIPHFESDIQNLQNGRKRPSIEFHQEQAPLNPTIALNEWNKNKRKKVSSFQQQQPAQQNIETVPGISDSRLNMPVRRSQKLSDKITALQKLVSPYGKKQVWLNLLLQTDIASVLEEASLYIKLLHQHIQNLFQMLRRSYNSLGAIHPPQNTYYCEQETEKKKQDLRGRGLCLVPISFAQKVTEEEKTIDTNSISGTNNHP